MSEADGLEGEVRSGTGEGAFFVGLEWVRAQVRSVCGFDPYPGSLNLALTDSEALERWREILKGPALVLTPPPPESCGARLFPVLVAGLVVGAVVVPDATRYGEDTLEVLAPVNLRSRLGLRDGDRVWLSPLSSGGV